jgi:hypothetical protein
VRYRARGRSDATDLANGANAVSKIFEGYGL